ncbi:macrolide ABC transporter ATP-binding protein [Phenylobacterium soli]|uniref:Macrolide ABC transporter ATP-binding protein n=2 Tax=Phenylobacterium soli TaxID=2170551 RepID=A0A328AS60_9CAUL|nr:ABC transporter ATP-binding protein [Phenylobacterium soli]RAK56364.1 macrolide ABC transporter ATP-binding protein [Phenylobacterium soli]
MIEVHGLKKLYTMGEEEVVALGGVDLTVERGEHVAVIGPSGSGKSTLMNILGGLDRPTAGDYRFEGEDIAHFDDNELAEFRRRRIGFVFQSFQLLPRLSALQNVELPMIYAGLTPRERRERAAHLLDRVGLGARKGHRPTQMSGGQQQRVAIARALANNPDLLLADEPTGALDSQTGQDVLKLFHELNAEGLTLMIVTHDNDIADQARRKVMFKDGLIVQDTMARPSDVDAPA